MFSPSRGDRDDGPRLMNAVVSRMSDGTIAKFVARNVVAEGTSTDRLAEAFQSLVQEKEQRQRLLALAHDESTASPLGNTEGFEGGVGTGRAKAADVVLRQALRLEGVRTRAVEGPHQGDRGRAGQRRPAGAHQRVAEHGRDERRCGRSI